jgi:hypothetical protein
MQTHRPQEKISGSRVFVTQNKTDKAYQLNTDNIEKENRADKLISIN